MQHVSFGSKPGLNRRNFSTDVENVSALVLSMALIMSCAVYCTSIERRSTVKCVAPKSTFSSCGFLPHSRFSNAEFQAFSCILCGLRQSHQPLS